MYNNYISSAIVGDSMVNMISVKLDKKSATAVAALKDAHFNISDLIRDFLMHKAKGMEK
jgi:hypothetical protein